MIFESRMNFRTQDEYEQYRKREGIGASSEKNDRRGAKRMVPQAIIDAHNRSARQNVPDTAWEDIIRRVKDYQKETNKKAVNRS